MPYRFARGLAALAAMAAVTSPVAGSASAAPPAPGVGIPLPTGRSLTPAGTLVTAGDFPASAVYAGGGVYVADDGQSVGSLQAVDPVAGAPTTATVPLEPLTPPATNAKPTANSGLLSVSPAGASLYLPGAALGTLDTFAVGAPGVAPTETSAVRITGSPQVWGSAGVAEGPHAGDVLVTEPFAGGGLGPSSDQGDTVAMVDPTTGSVAAEVTVGRQPFGIVDGEVPAATGGGATVERAVALDRESGQLSVIDPSTMTVVATVSTPRAPASAVFVDGGRQLLVTCSLDDEVAVVDTSTWTVTQTVPVRPGSGLGAAPAAVAVDPAGDTAWATLGPDDAVAQLDRGPDGTWALAGEIPTATYPTGVAYVPATALQGAQLAISDGKGTGLPLGTASGLPEVAANTSDPDQTGLGLSGSVELVAVPDASTLAGYSAQVAADDSVTAPETGCPVPASLQGITHVVYVIRENKTYDEEFGDTAYGDPSLAMYPQAVTPNTHAIAMRSVLMGNFYSDEEVSDTGHAAVMGGVANDFLERTTQQSYGLGGTPRQGPELGNDDDTNWSPSDFLLDDALTAGKSFRDYGEFYRKDQSDDSQAVSPGLGSHIETGLPGFGFDPNTPDTARIAYWAKQFSADEANGTFPDLEVIYLPEDHTTDNTPTATAPVPETPVQQVADSDLATGQLVDDLSHSQYWDQTAVFLTEDDPQSGLDHVDDHRTIGLVTGGRVVNTETTAHYDSGSMLRTMEEILGLPAMTEFDATAAPMDALFSAAPDPVDSQPYSAVTPAPTTLVAPAAQRAYAASVEAGSSDIADLAPATQFAIQWEATHGDAPVPTPEAVPAWARSAATTTDATGAGVCAAPTGLAEVDRAGLLPAAAAAAGVAVAFGAGRRRRRGKVAG